MARPTKPARTYDHLKAKTDTPADHTPRLDVHAAITAKIMAAIEAGAGDFHMPWHRPGVAFTLPVNALTEKAYRGSNVLALWIDADEKKYEHQVWATFKQWRELDAGVRKSEKGSLIVKYGEWTPKGKAKDDVREVPNHTEVEDDSGKRLFARAAYVFNIDQVDIAAEARAHLLPTKPPRPDLTMRLAAVDAFVTQLGVEIREGGQRAFYRARSLNDDGDFIQIPARALFTGTATSTPTESYYATLLHEEIHASGAAHRLNRTFGERFGDNAYAFEELIAELGSAFLCAHFEVTNVPRPDHAQYIAHWLDVLRGDTRAIFTASAMATKAVDYLIGKQPQHDSERLPLQSDADTQPTRPDSEAHALSSKSCRGPKT